MVTLAGTPGVMACCEPYVGSFGMSVLAVLAIQLAPADAMLFRVSAGAWLSWGYAVGSLIRVARILQCSL